MAYYSKLLNIFPTPRYLKFSYVGVDITPSCVRYAELFNDSGGIRLGRFGEKKFPKSADIFSNEALKEILRDMKRKEGIDFIKSTLPEEMTYLFSIDVEGNDHEEIRENIEFHLEENVPVSGPDALFEFYVLPETVDGKKQAVVSVVSRETVMKYTNLFESCGITPISFMVESSSLSRVTSDRDDLSTYLLVNLYKQKTVCAVVSQGYVQFSSTVNTGGDIITDSLQKHYSISEEEAEKMKQEKGLLKNTDDKDVFSVVMSSISVLKDEIEKVSIYWQTHRDKSSKGSIQKIILAGEESGIAGFADYLSVTLKLDVHLVNVWGNLPIYKDEIPPISQKDSLAFGPCLGLSIGVTI